MPIKIITDSTANITADQIDGIDHVTVPLSLHVDALDGYTWYWFRQVSSYAKAYEK